MDGMGQTYLFCSSANRTSRGLIDLRGRVTAIWVRQIKPDVVYYLVTHDQKTLTA
ncbi:MAG TPA: hypothetical protein VHK27_02525 [Gammaproteobacteria bacterium]|nr:hypothetical protein [Gammaproteobacteria bacterium]